MGLALLKSANCLEQLHTSKQYRVWKTLHKSVLECSLISSLTPPSQQLLPPSPGPFLHQATETWTSQSWHNMQLWASAVERMIPFSKLAHISVMQSRQCKTKRKLMRGGRINDSTCLAHTVDSERINVITTKKINSCFCRHCSNPFKIERHAQLRLLNLKSHFPFRTVLLQTFTTW